MGFLYEGRGLGPNSTPLPDLGVTRVFGLFDRTPFFTSVRALALLFTPWSNWRLEWLNVETFGEVQVSWSNVHLDQSWEFGFHEVVRVLGSMSPPGMFLGLLEG